MYIISKFRKWHGLITLALLFTLMLTPERAEAQWPPFRFNLTPAYSQGKITYNLSFAGQVEGGMTDVMIKIPLPQGTRFLNGYVPSTTSVSFDGQEVTFFTAVLHRPLQGASFEVEVTDPNLAVFTTHAWIAWKGSVPGDFLTEDVSIDITKPALNWVKPASPRLQIQIKAEVANDVITYLIYPKNVGGLRMWDVRITLPIPAGATFLSAEAQPPFEAGVNGPEATFFMLELARQAQVEPLKVKVSTAGITTPFAVTQAWASWKNAGRSVGVSVPVEEQAKTGDIVVQPHASQQVVADIIGDVPFSNYDISNIVLEQDDSGLKTGFYLNGEIGRQGEPLTFVFAINADCADRAEYQAVYNHKNGRAHFQVWNAESNKWNPPQPIEVSLAISKTISLNMPYHLFVDRGHAQEFCGTGRATNSSKDFITSLPNDGIPNTSEPRLLHVKF